MHLNDDDWWEDDEPILPPLAMTEVTVTITDNPVVATLLDASAVLRQWRERPPFGFQRP